MYLISSVFDTIDSAVVRRDGPAIVFPGEDALQIRKPHYEVIYCLDSLPFPLKVDWENMDIVLLSCPHRQQGN